MARASIELSMIVKDGAATLERCIESVKPCVDRVVVGDTGSTDGSIEIARNCGAEVVEIPWEQDFSKARNRMLGFGQCDWVLVLDADEMLDGDGRLRIPELIGREEVDAYDVTRWNYVSAAHTRSAEEAPRVNPIVIEAARAFPAYTVTVNTRLFRRDPEIYFEYCVHETVAHRIDALGKRRAPADFLIHHLGLVEDSEAIRRGKNETYQKLGLRKLEAEAGNPIAWFEVGLGELEHYKRPGEALAYFERARMLDERDARSWLFAGICLVRTGKFEEALKRFTVALKLGLRSPVLFEAIGDAYFHAGEHAQAREAYEYALGVGGVSPLNSAKLGASEIYLGLKVEGIERIQRAVESSPEFEELYDILIAGALLGGDAELAEKTREKRLLVG